jgi:hypothetical protein
MNGGQKWRRHVSLAVGLVALMLLAPASASAGGGLKPSEAPLVTVGQHYFGNTYHAGNVSDDTADLWRLPPLLTSDVVTVAWNLTGEYESRPDLCLAQDVDDYNWAEYHNRCNGSAQASVSGSRSARTAFPVRSATSAPFLEFWGNECCGSQAYDFVVEAIQHAIGVGLSPRTYIRTSATLLAHASLSNGLPMPDGSTFYLNASWGSRGYTQYSATSSGGNLNFPVALPPETIGQTVTFTVIRPVDPQFLAAQSAGMVVKIARPKPAAVTPSHPRRCRRGFKKRKVNGRTRCVRIKRRHHH